MKKFLLSVGVALTAMGANAGYFVDGDVCGWSHCDAAYEMSMVSEGVYELTIPAPGELSGAFFVLEGEVGTPDWGQKWASNGDKLVANEEYYYIARDGAEADVPNIQVDGTIKNAKVTINFNEGYILVTGDSQANEYETLYIIGNYTEADVWSNELTNAMTANADKSEFTGTVDVTRPECGYLKIKGGTVDFGGDPAAETENVIVEGPSTTEFKLAAGGKAFQITPGKYDVTVKLPYNAEEGTVVFAAADAAIEGVEADNNVAPVYYNLQGVRVDNAANGLYIVVRGDKAAKEFVR